MKRASLAVLAGALLWGCAATADRAQSLPQQAALSKAPTCLAAEQCAAMWAAARWWALHSCGYALEKDTPDLIETYNTVNNTVPRAVSRALACRITRAPRPEGGSAFAATASCSAVSPPANPCDPPVSEAVDEFNRSLNRVAARFDH
ncbi:MAG TPA: hypothetical protein VF931_07555 [Steroidobacteraceae bacterium]